MRKAHNREVKHNERTRKNNRARVSPWASRRVQMSKTFAFRSQCLMILMGHFQTGLHNDFRNS
jgi:hypothetical protein